MRCGPLVAQYLHTDYLMEEAEAYAYYDMICKLDDDGVDMVGMENALISLGFFGVKTMANLGKPRLENLLEQEGIVVCVSYLEGSRDDGHWSVVESFNDSGEFIELWDPDLGETRFMPWQHFDTVWYDYTSEYVLVAKAAVIGYTVEPE